jgi:hypothetical protein
LQAQELVFEGPFTHLTSEHASPLPFESAAAFEGRQGESGADAAGVADATIVSSSHSTYEHSMRNGGAGRGAPEITAEGSGAAEMTVEGSALVEAAAVTTSPWGTGQWPGEAESESDRKRAASAVADGAAASAAARGEQARAAAEAALRNASDNVSAGASADVDAATVSAAGLDGKHEFESRRAVAGDGDAVAVVLGGPGKSEAAQRPAISPWGR